ncbi:MAG: YeeE/YedE family protein [bacterium]
MRSLLAFLSGGLFALGLSVSGMTDPSKVLGFLDVSGAWDPSLMWVMVGAIAVFASVYWFVKRSKPVLAPSFHPPTRVGIDGRLIAGSVLFGVGWGLSGICPGPAVVNAASGQVTYVAFAMAMTVVLVGSRWVTHRTPEATLRSEVA